MSVQSINGIGTTPNVQQTNRTNTTQSASAVSKKDTSASSVSSTAASTGFDETAVVYEKSQQAADSVTVKNNAFDREAIIAQMKADTEARANQLTGIVQQMMAKQGNSIGLADDMWKFLAKGDFEVSADVKAQAQADIAEDGYWGVEQTSDRILDFAKALSGGDASKADELFEAFKKGFKEATGTWGKDLPDISQKTYDAVEEKFEAWKAEAKETQAATDAANQAANKTVDPATGVVVQ
uniref:hypothetical protein n=1 Tax=Agathobacter sp. TaxID=2021311 RepID=UPI004055CD73